MKKQFFKVFLSLVVMLGIFEFSFNSQVDASLCELMPLSAPPTTELLGGEVVATSSMSIESDVTIQCGSGSIGKLSNYHVNQLYTKYSVTPHQVKYEYYGKKAKVKYYDLYYDKKSRYVYVGLKNGTNLERTIFL